ncbi:hypothetical protein C8R44DRAFT_736606 [Mycena epipterygia]|nr:hypothetical protein C8R44DRAFT_736606 [Mycena epipterygia]
MRILPLASKPCSAAGISAVERALVPRMACCRLERYMTFLSPSRLWLTTAKAHLVATHDTESAALGRTLTAGVPSGPQSRRGLLSWTATLFTIALSLTTNPRGGWSTPRRNSHRARFPCATNAECSKLVTVYTAGARSPLPLASPPSMFFSCYSQAKLTAPQPGLTPRTTNGDEWPPLQGQVEKSIHVPSMEGNFFSLEQPQALDSAVEAYLTSTRGTLYRAGLSPLTISGLATLSVDSLQGRKRWRLLDAALPAALSSSSRRDCSIVLSPPRVPHDHSWRLRPAIGETDPSPRMIDCEQRKLCDKSTPVPSVGVPLCARFTLSARDAQWSSAGVVVLVRITVGVKHRLSGTGPPFPADGTELELEFNHIIPHTKPVQLAARNSTAFKLHLEQQQQQQQQPPHSSIAQDRPLPTDEVSAQYRGRRPRCIIPPFRPRQRAPGPPLPRFNYRAAIFHGIHSRLFPDCFYSPLAPLGPVIVSAGKWQRYRPRDAHTPVNIRSSHRASSSCCIPEPPCHSHHILSHNSSFSTPLQDHLKPAPSPLRFFVDFCRFLWTDYVMGLEFGARDQHNRTLPFPFNYATRRGWLRPSVLY